jgi:DNA modification methylase
VQATRTKTLALAHKQIIKDSAMCGQGLPDYLITMRKGGENPEPVSRVRGFEDYIGTKDAPAEGHKTDNPRTNKYSHKVWQRYASPVWFDIRQTETLQYRSAREHKDERHICPLQLDVIRRGVELWTNEGDTILSPFMGIGSEGYVALEMNRKFVGIEIKESYYKQAVANLSGAISNKSDLLSYAEEDTCKT